MLTSRLLPLVTSVKCFFHIRYLACSFHGLGQRHLSGVVEGALLFPSQDASCLIMIRKQTVYTFTKTQIKCWLTACDAYYLTHFSLAESSLTNHFTVCSTSREKNDDFIIKNYF
jgi:hypothetical protein